MVTELTSTLHMWMVFSLIHGEPERAHIWTFVAAVAEAIAGFITSKCRCMNQWLPQLLLVLLAMDYFCDTGGSHRV